jgi:hypothetical protein
MSIVENTEDEVVVVEDDMIVSTDIALQDTHAVSTYTPAKVLGGIPHLLEYVELSQAICQSAMVPTTLRNKPGEVLAVIMYGAELGIGPMQALQQINFIEGKPSTSPELMRALIRKAGHVLKITQSNTRCVIVGIRGDTHEEGKTDFTIDDAITAGLCYLDDKGIVRARSRENKPLPWEKYTRDMLLARATSRIARMMFSDVVAGLSYTPEEVESFTIRDDEPPAKKSSSTKKSNTTRRAAPSHESEDSSDDVVRAMPEQLQEIEEQLAFLTEDEKRQVAQWWKSKGFARLENLDKFEADKVKKYLFDFLNAESSDATTSRDTKESDENRNIDTSQMNSNDLKAPKCSEAQVKKIRAMMHQTGVDNKDVHTRASDIIRRQISSLKDLTKAEATKVIDQLNADVGIESTPYRGGNNKSNSRDFAPDEERFER